jgi:hypothetical protein
MGILLGLSPFIAFAVIERTVGPAAGLFAGALVAAGLLVHDLMSPGRSAKLLDIGTTLLFCTLAALAPMRKAGISIMGVRLLVDTGLLLIVLVSLAIGRPFTLQYAREQVSAEHWHSAAFLRTNYIVSFVWALAFAVIVAADAAMLCLPDLPQKFGLLTIVLALVGAIKFSMAYPAYVRRSSAGAAG